MRPPFQAVACLLLAVGTVAGPGAGMAALPPLPDPLDGDPVRPGPFRVGSGEYLLGLTSPTPDGVPGVPSADDAGFPPYTLRGVAYFPTDARGRLPVVVVVHGNHLPVVDSHHGYAYLGTHLASHGAVVLSVDANEVNARAFVRPFQDYAARSTIALATLDRLRAPDPLQPPLLPPGFPSALDFGSVGLMGHSRGGLSVQMAAAENLVRPDPLGIRAVFAIAPAGTDPLDGGVAVAAMVGTCDGDTGPSQAVPAFDGLDIRQRHFGDGPRHLLVAIGANHNHYNTRWAEDEWTLWSSPDTIGDPVCSLGLDGFPAARMTPEDQRRHARAFVAAFFGLYLQGKQAGRAWLADQAPAPGAACPAAPGADCGAALHVSHRPAQADRLLLEDGAGATSGANDLGGASLLAGFAAAGSCMAPGARCGGPRYESWVDATAVAWNATASWRLEVPAARRADVAAFTALSLRAAVGEEGPPGVAQDFRLVLEDGSGRRTDVLASSFTRDLLYPPGTASQAPILHGMRVPFAAFAGVDASDLAAVELVFDQTPAGHLELADLWFVR
jgi:hypothetical protein